MTKSNKIAETPLMKQYNAIKAKHPDAILLFRVGDFYETFSEDAIKASEILGITLTRRANGAAAFIELAGFPHHALDNYLPKLVRSGQRVAICEQLEDPKTTKKIVKRGVTELVTPGVSHNDNVLENRENNFLASINLQKNLTGIAFLDISTGEFFLSEGTVDYVDKLLNSFRPKEVLFERSKRNAILEAFGPKFYFYPLEDWAYEQHSCNERLLHQFGTKSLKGFGIEDLNFGITAAGSILQYLNLTQHNQTSHITKIKRIDEGQHVWLDRFTIRNLELFQSMNEGGKTLIDVIDKTISPMGSRLMKRWIALPLKNIIAINNRLDIVDFFIKAPDSKLGVEENIRLIGDLERIISKVAIQRINPREVVQLKNALKAIEPIKKICNDSKLSELQNLDEQLNPCLGIRDRIENEITENPPVSFGKGKVIAEGFNSELDDLRNIAYSGKDYIAKIQEKESEATGIPSLKIGFNNVFGYYIEVRNTHKDKVPDGWIRKQTLVSAERYITQELKEYEQKVLGAEEKILELEQKLYNELVIAISDYIQAIQLNASIVARLDCLISFAELAERENYARPVLNETNEIDITEGRHPVIEQQLPIDEQYISNSIKLNDKDQQIIMITGPNMSGKSALLRQTALIVLMSQIGSFVPAEEAKIGYVDKIFTRVGASDNISLGESTFMVEMNEAASILNNLSSRSLVLLDELGRGTSTYDGISIAWAIAEYIHEHPLAKAKTLFATHYHELNEMEPDYPRIKNYNVSVKEIDKKIVFLRKLAKGGSEHSFGIHVAKMAGMPKSVVERANEILHQLEGKESKSSLAKPVSDLGTSREGYQLSFFQLDDPVLKQIRDELRKVDINNLTPIEALTKLNDIKRHIGFK